MDRGGRRCGRRPVLLPALAIGTVVALTGCGGPAGDVDRLPSAPLSASVTDLSPTAATDGPGDPTERPATEDPPPLTPAEEAAEAAARDALRAAQGYVPPAASDLAAGEGWADGPAGSWADRLPVAAAVTMVRGAGPGAVRRAFAGGGTVREFPSAADAQDWVDLRWEDRRWFAVGSRDGVTFAWESFGSTGVDGSVLAPLSRDGTAASFFVNPEDLPWRLVVARGGTVVENADSDTSDLTGRAAARRIARATGAAVLSPGWLDEPAVQYFGVQS